jgi:hypothetical protein
MTHGGWLRRASGVLFHGYVGMLILAGGWGVVFGRIDQSLLLGLDLDGLPPRVRANVMVQYRFLRAMELGFGLFAFVHRDKIHRERPYNRLFLFTMGGGVFARALSLVRDGSPSPVMYAFGGSELLGVVVIYADTRATLEPGDA